MGRRSRRVAGQRCFLDPNSGYVPNPAYKVDLTVNGDLTVAAGGSVDVSGQGYSDASSPAGAGTGGGHGGRNSTSATCFGSITAPTNVAGSESFMYRGGGAVKLTVSGTIQNNGVICSDGGSAGRGAGGSVWLESGNLTGSGVIRANGNVGRGGGRVALVVTNSGADFSTYSGTVSAFATSSGGAGTVYRRKAGQGINAGELIIDNNNVNANSTEISPYVTDAFVGDVVIRNSGRLVVDTNETLTLSGVWSNAAIFEGRSGSQIVFGGGALSTAKIYGVTSFMGFTSTNTTGKTIMFEAGKTNAIAAYGRLRLVGAETAFSLFTGQVHARSSRLAGGVGAANNGAGTVYSEHPGVGRGRGTVVVDNGNFSATGNTDVPPAFNYTAKEASWAVFRVANGAKLRLTNDFTVGDIWLDTSNAILDLGFNTLYVNSFSHDLGPGVVTNYGAIKWIQGALIQFW